MRYAITFTTDRESWNSVDTFIVETDENPLDMTKEQIITMFDTYVCDTDIAEKLADDEDLWFIHNVDDTDVSMRGQ